MILFLLFWFIILVVLVYLVLDPFIDKVEIKGKETKILWYNGLKGRRWIKLW